MRKTFDDQLRQLNNELMNMGAMVEQAIEKSVDALISKDVATAKKIMEYDHEVDQQEKTIQSLCFDLLMQQQPVARDLRLISAAMNMITDMERIGDHASDISEVTLLMVHTSYETNMEHIRRMAAETLSMLIKSIKSFVDRDIKAAREVIENDDVVDELFLASKKDVIDLIRSDREAGEEAVDLLMVAKYFERIGDHATNIAEWVIFAVDNQRDTVD
jgi:phosphate transport system protein